MDFLDPKKKRAHKHRLFIGYALMAIFIFLVSMLLVFAAYGYNIDPRTGTITQSGLVFIDAHPESAAIKLNGEDKGNTSQRLVLPAGGYKLELTRDGYRQWSRSFSLDGGTIERLVYPFLFPTDLKTADVQLYAAEPTLATQSPDRRWLITQQPKNIKQLDMIDLLSDTPVSAALVLPNGLLNSTGNNHSLVDPEWSTDNRHFLVKHVFDGGSEIVLIDREQPSASQNLSKVFNQTNIEVTLLDKKYDRYYIFNPGTGSLVTGELQNARTIPYLEQVLNYKSHGDNVVLFTTAKAASPGNVQVKIRQGDQEYLLRELPTSPNYLLDLARFDGKWFVAAGSSNDQRVYIYKNPVDLISAVPLRKLLPVTTLRIDHPEFASFSNNARFIAVQAGSKFAVYDAETSRSYRYDTSLPINQGFEAKWMDGHRLTYVSEQKVHIFDFDGTNIQTLNSSSDKYVPFFHRDYDALFCVAPSVSVTGRSALTRTELIVEPAQ